MSGTIQPRIYERMTSHVITSNVAFNTVGVTAGLQVGAIPAGAQILDIVVTIATVFNAATTNVLTVGTTAGGSQLATTAETAAGVAGGKRAVTGLGLVAAVDSGIFVTYTQTGTAATTGAARVSIVFIPNMDRT